MRNRAGYRSWIFAPTGCIGGVCACVGSRSFEGHTNSVSFPLRFFVPLSSPNVLCVCIRHVSCARIACRVARALAGLSPTRRLSTSHHSQFSRLGSTPIPSRGREPSIPAGGDAASSPERAGARRSRREPGAGRTPTAALRARLSNLVLRRDATMGLGLQGCCLVSPGCTPTAAWLAARAARPSFGSLGLLRLPGRFSFPSFRSALPSPRSASAASDARTCAAAGLGCRLVVRRDRLSRHGRVARPP